MQPSKPSSKSVFLKKHVFTKQSDEAFKFNFKEPETVNDINEDIMDISIDDTRTTTVYRFKPSDNSFRFNFNIAD